MNTNAITIDDIKAARQRLADYIRYTPVAESPSLTQLTKQPIYLKLEHQQITSSFKIRGASNAIGQLSDQQKQAGVVCVSTGNHSRGIAFAAKQTEVKALIYYMSSLVPYNKVKTIAELGAEVKIAGISQDEAESEALEYCQQSGANYLPPFDHRDIICGQGTLELEILEQVPDVESVLVPLSGGGIGLNNKFTFDIVKTYVDQILQVSEAEIAQAIRHTYFNEKQIIEGGASVGIASLLANKTKLAGPTVALLSGSNIDMSTHKTVLDGANSL